MPGEMTAPQRRALEALVALSDKPWGTAQRPHGWATPSAVAQFLWPDSEGWTKASRRGSTPAGGALGATMPMKAAKLLWRLFDLHYAYRESDGNQWYPTSEGRRALEERSCR